MVGDQIIDELIAIGPLDAPASLGNVLRRHAGGTLSMASKAELLEVLEANYADSDSYAWLQKMLIKRPVRSLSGVTTITALTKPFPCPGRCVFCPVDVRMPKSYIATEPGAARAGALGFDPYEQVTVRLRSYSQTGHPISKIEFIVLGGTWSAYPDEYKRWFIKRMFDALNDFGTADNTDQQSYPTDWADRVSNGESYNDHIEASQYVTEAHVESATQDELELAHKLNETADVRCVGLSLETRPDLVDVAECISLRSLGATKIQIGIQSMNDQVLRLNKRGHLVHKTESAIRMLRRFGFKVHAHWMPNLYGATPDGDIADYDKVFSNLSVRPDELKVYPTVLIQDTELEQLANKGKWNGYEPAELTRVLDHVLTTTPEYTRLTRIIRDIPEQEILGGNKLTNLRQIVERSVSGTMHDIRAREVKGEAIPTEELELEELNYDTAESREVFLQFVRPSDRTLAGFCRLSLPVNEAPIDELAGAAIIREVHVYGQSVAVGDDGPVQHRGLGKRLIARAEQLAIESGYKRMAIISAVGTRKYYERLGFRTDGMYQLKSL